MKYNIYKFYNNLRQNIQFFAGFYVEDIQKNRIKRRNKKINILGHKNLENNSEFIVEKNLESSENVNIMLLNFNLQLIITTIQQEFEIIKLQNYASVEAKPFLYELLYLGLQGKMLDYNDTKPIIEAFYQTNRITKNQYLTLINHYYLEDKEYEE